MPLFRTNELVSARELAEITESWSMTDSSVVTTDFGEYRYDEQSNRWRFWVYRDAESPK